MSRVAIQVDERLLVSAIERHGFSTAQAAVDYALDRAILAAALGTELPGDEVSRRPGDRHTSSVHRAPDGL